MPEAENAFACICKALAEPMRFGLLSRIAQADADGGEVGCKTLVAEFPVSQATISHHLKELQRAGLIESRMDGACLFLRPNAEKLEAFCDELRERLALNSVRA
ncbi:MAG: metalloregulator ArsR/SmtB family transcription factor [Planctomycetota bacterium]